MEIVKMNKKIMVKGFIFLIALFFLSLYLQQRRCFAFDFVTKKDFDAQKITYKNLPLNMLFKKFAESDGLEKRRIRNAIILKQAFSERINEKVRAGKIRYKKISGIIKHIGRDNLRLWLPKINTGIKIFVGIDHIPLINESRYKVTELNIDHYASTIYTLDNRIYKVKIDLKIAPPSGLHIKRENSHNIVEWTSPKGTKKPDKYSFFVNGKLFVRTKDTFVSVPRVPGRVDEYYTKAAYRLGDTFVESEPSDVIVDEISAKEIRMQLQAENIYKSIILSLTPSEWKNGKRLLYENRQLLNDYLNKQKQKNVFTLIDYFHEIDEGRRLSNMQAESMENFEKALTFYQHAEQKAKDLPPGVDLSFITKSGIAQIRRQMAGLKNRDRQLTALNIYNRILGSLNQLEWEKGKKLLYDNQLFLNDNLDKVRREKLLQLKDYFSKIEQGDLIVRKKPENQDSFEAALIHYESAEDMAKEFPDDMDVSFIARLKIMDVNQRKEMLKEKDRHEQAEKTWAMVTGMLNPSEWEKGKSLLYEKRQFLEENLDKERKQTVSSLMQFFTGIDGGDTIGEKKPETSGNLDTALMFYRRAEEKAKVLPAGINVAFISRLKADDIKNRKKMLKEKDRYQQAEKTYAMITGMLNPSEWEKGKSLLYEKRQFLEDNLDKERKERILSLIRFFTEIDSGDSLGARKPETAENLDTALMFYRRAEEKGKSFTQDIDVSFIPRIKINETGHRISLLEAKKRKALVAQKKDMEAAQNFSVPSLTKALPSMPVVKRVDSKTAVKEGLKYFRRNEYEVSFNYFKMAFGKQMNYLKHKDNRRIMGLLSLPVKYRAQIVFLAEFDRLRQENKNDTELIREGLEELSQSIENGEGMWTVIPEAKRRKFLDLIEQY